MKQPVPSEHPYRQGDWGREIYPMASFPTLAVTDLAASSEWYQRVLGFADVFTMRAKDETPFLVHLRWCTHADLLLVPRRATVEQPGQGVTLNFMSENSDAVAERAAAEGARIIEGPVERPWNVREVTIADPDGYRLNFPSAIRRSGAPEDFAKVVDRVRNARG